MIATLVLAAGASSRFGLTKQLLPLGGIALVRHPVEAAREAGLVPVFVVVGHDAERVSAALPEDVGVVVNPHHDRGQSTSLRAGLDALEPLGDAELEGVVVLLGDQPGVRPEDLRALAAAFREQGGPVARLRYEGGPGPALLGREVWSEIRGLVGDTGARAVLDAHPEWIGETPVAAPQPPDVDTWEDYDLLRMADASPASERRNALPPDLRRRHDEIAAALLRHDPIGIDMGDNVDEYEPEAATIAPRLAEARSAEILRRVIHEEFVRWFDADTAGPTEDYRALADELWSAWATDAGA